MRKTFRLLALMLALLMLVLPVLASCDDTPDGPVDPDNPGGGGTGGSGTGDRVNYTVSIKTLGGMPLSGVNIYAYADEALTDLRGYGAVDANGIANISLPRGNTYRAVLKGVPEGYNLEKSYLLNSSGTQITLTSSVIADQNINGVIYELGDVMHDFTVVDCDGKTFQLSEALKEKEMVLINFWYTTCSWCVKEFPYMQSVYERYQDKVAIIALDPYTSDTEEAIKSFRDEMGLTFQMAKDFTSLTQAFGDFIQGYPTSVIVDRYGVICAVECGGIVSEKPFVAIFDHFTGDKYEQKLIEDLEELTPTELPNVDMPSSDEIGAVLNTGDITVTYSPETDPEDSVYSWPFVIGNKADRDCIYASNINKDGSFATLYAEVTMKAGEALGFDYFASSEVGVDILYVIVDGKDIYQISGDGSDWETCYPWVAKEDGTYELALCYLKDESDDVGDDTVYISNLRVVPEADIDVETFIPRNCATNRAEDGFGYETYVDVFYNEADGYYHVGSENGPLLLASLMSYSQFGDIDLYTLAYNGKIVVDGVNYYNDLLEYFSYASNSALLGYSTVTQELKDLLVKVTQAVGMEQNQDVPNEKEWLQICSYYDAYCSGGKQFPDPLAGLADFSAPPVVESTLGDTDFPNAVKFDRIIMPRGLMMRFTPTTSGVYHVVTNSTYATSAWIFLAGREEVYVHEDGDRLWNDPNNCSFYYYMEAGKDYYINIAYDDPYQVGTIQFRMERVGDTFKQFNIASPGYFTFEDSEDYENTGIMGETIAGGIDVVLGSDGFYYEKETYGDPERQSKLYADFSNLTPIFNKSLEKVIQAGGFNLALSADDQQILAYINAFETTYKEDEDGNPTEELLYPTVLDGFKALWGENYAEYAELYQLEDVMNGIYHGHGKDYTAEASVYLDKMISQEDAPDNPELWGCVEVDEELAELLQILMDKYTFKDVEHSWTKLCYYYQFFGPEAEA